MPFASGQNRLRGQYLLIGDCFEQTARLVLGGNRLAAVDAGFPIRIAVATVSGSSTGWPSTNGAAPAAWKPHIRGVRLATPGALVLGVTAPVGRDIPAVADRQDVQVRRVAEVVDDLEGRGLLPLDPDRVDRVDQGDRVGVGKLIGPARGTRRSCRRSAPPWRRARSPGPASRWRSARQEQRRSAAVPPRQAYAAAEAEVFPVEAQTTALAPAPAATLSATVIPRSLKDPVGLLLRP